MLRAARLLAAGEAPVAGGAGLRAGALPLVLTGAVWGPDPTRLAEIDPFAEAEGLPPAAVLPAGDAAEAGLRAAGWAPVAGIALDEGAAAGAGPEGAPVGWDRALEAAGPLAGRNAEPELAAALATLLASAVAEDDELRLELGGSGEGAAALLVHEDEAAALVVLSGGPAGRMEAAALAAARGLGKAAWRLREVPPGAPEARLVRWERPA